MGASVYPGLFGMGRGEMIRLAPVPKPGCLLLVPFPSLSTSSHPLSMALDLQRLGSALTPWAWLEGAGVCNSDMGTGYGEGVGGVLCVAKVAPVLTYIYMWNAHVCLNRLTRKQVHP